MLLLNSMGFNWFRKQDVSKDNETINKYLELKNSEAKEIINIKKEGVKTAEIKLTQSDYIKAAIRIEDGKKGQGLGSKVIKEGIEKIEEKYGDKVKGLVSTWSADCPPYTDNLDKFNENLAGNLNAESVKKAAENTMTGKIMKKLGYEVKTVITDDGSDIGFDGDGEQYGALVEFKFKKKKP